MELDHLNNLVDVHDARANRCDEEHHNNGVKDSAHIGKAAWQVMIILRYQGPWQRFVALPCNDADVTNLDTEANVAKDDCLDAHEHTYDVQVEVHLCKRVLSYQWAILV